MGDDAQSIYSFRAATVRNILDFPSQFVGATVIALERNYRSTQPILDATNAVMALAEEGAVAFAKAAMFFSAGLLAEALGHDQIAKLGGAARVLPLTFLTIALGGLSLMGLPPSGGFRAKWLLLQASVASGQWLWTLPVLAGGLLVAGYVYRILAPALSNDQISLASPPDRSREVIALALTAIAIALGFDALRRGSGQHRILEG